MLGNFSLAASLIQGKEDILQLLFAPPNHNKKKLGAEPKTHNEPRPPHLPKIIMLDFLLSWPALLVLLAVLVYTLDLPRVIYTQHRNLKKIRAIPTPQSLPNNHWLHSVLYWVLGDIPAVYKQNEELILSSIEEMNRPDRKNYRIGKIWVGPFIVTLHINHSSCVKELLKEPKSDIAYNMLRPWLGEGLLIAEGNKWFRNRRLLTPAFHFDILKGYVPVYNECLAVLLKKWSKAALDGQPVKLFDTLCPMTLDTLLRCTFSFKSDCQTSTVKHPYVIACSELVHLSSDRIMNPLYLIDWLYWHLPHGKKMKRLCDLVHKHSEDIISQRKLDLEHILRAKVTNEDLFKEVSKTRKYLDFLDILLTAVDDDGKGMEDLEIRNEVDTFMFEGHDTTTSALSWTLYCLAQHPEHQDKVREEVRSVLMGRDQLEYDDLKELKYTSWCIKEGMRLYPPVFFFFRKTTDDVQINGLCVPKGYTVAIDTLLIHRNINIWERPLEFDPLRFHPSNIEKHSPYDYIPFSAGHRNCIGQNFAMNEMKVVIGTIVNRFVLKVDETHKVEMVPKVVLRTANDIKLLIKPSV